MKLFISAGEPSGDLHGANLARELLLRNPELEIVGFGGDRMTAAGVKLFYPLTQLAVMWLGKALANLPKFLHLGAVAESYFRRERPDAVILIDYPGFHWHIAARAHRYGIPVYYFVPPQLWAWAGWRVNKVRRNFRAVLTALPFEEDWYRTRGVRTHYVGHPYFDEIASQKLDPQFLAAERSKPGRIVALLPGSRGQELQANFTMMLQSARKIAAAHPDVRFMIAAYKDAHAQILAERIAESGLPISIHVGKTPEIIELSTVCLSVSGSVSLEMLVRRKPTVIVYKVGKLFKFIAEQLKTCKYITLVNLLADEELFPEFGVAEDRSSDIANHLIRWLGDAQEYQRLATKLDDLAKTVATPGAVANAAEFLLAELSPKLHS